MKLKVRPAKQSDLMLIFNWANDPLTRKNSFNQAPIPLETHKEWFRRVLSQPGTHLVIVDGCQQGKWVALAQVRVDEDGEVSMALAAEFRGRHLAGPVIKAAMAHIKGKLDTKSLVAHIKQENIPSVKAFEKAGFRFACHTTVEGHECLKYTYTMV